jgi:chaperonin GroEL
VAVEALKAMSRPVKTAQGEGAGRHDLGAQRPAIGELVAEAMEKVGNEGVITVRRRRRPRRTLEVVEGMQFDRGYISPYFVTDAEKMEAVLETRWSCCRPQDQPYQGPAAASRAVAQVREADWSSPRTSRARRWPRWWSTSSAACLRGCAVKAPGFGDRRKAMLQDIAVLTGGQVISERARADARDMRRSTSSAAPSGSSSTRTPPRSSAAPATRRRSRRACGQIRPEIDKTTSDYDREKLEERLAKLAGGVAVIRVGAPSEAR